MTPASSQRADRDVDVAVLVLSTMIGLAGVAAMTASVSGDCDATKPVPRRRSRRRVVERALAAVTTAGLVAVVSGWAGPAVVLGVGAWWSVSTWQQRHRGDRREIDRVDALASWIENLRDVLVAGEQPLGAIAATVPTCPSTIRPAVRRLAAGLGRQDPDVVFRRFADELDDPIGDLVATGLLIAVRRGARTVGVLSALADQARQQADRRRLVAAERAPTRREVSALTVVMSALVAALFVFGRSDYLRAYDDPAGQLFLAGGIAAYAALLVRVQHLARFPRPARFLTLDGRAA
jgi:hypothetical protein